jgi:uncharacterized protein
MLWAGQQSGLELRTEGGETRLLGRFPYGRETVLREAGDGGPELREVFAPRAFDMRVNDGSANIHLLAGHDFAKPLASRGAGSLTLTDTPDALLLEARIDPALANVTYVSDILAGIRAGLTIGISPGFRVASITGSEEIKRSGNMVLRTVHLAHLEEVSIVTRPAYPDAQIEARSWRSPTIADRRDPTFRYRKWRPT